MWVYTINTSIIYCICVRLARVRQILFKLILLLKHYNYCSKLVESWKNLQNINNVHCTYHTKFHSITRSTTGYPTIGIDYRAPRESSSLCPTINTPPHLNRVQCNQYLGSPYLPPSPIAFFLLINVLFILYLYTKTVKTLFQFILNFHLHNPNYATDCRRINIMTILYLLRFPLHIIHNTLLYLYIRLRVPMYTRRINTTARVQLSDHVYAYLLFIYIYIYITAHCILYLSHVVRWYIIYFMRAATTPYDDMGAERSHLFHTSTFRRRRHRRRTFRMSPSHHRRRI